FIGEIISGGDGFRYDNLCFLEKDRRKIPARGRALFRPAENRSPTAYRRLSKKRAEVFPLRMASSRFYHENQS
ncbi:MAG: hypothetical protein II965_08235, partial [Pyramidobacter sp.]|nr:hypothetical protein [Pyramidobacter sp.]